MDPREGELRRRIRETLFVPATLPELEVEQHGSFRPEPGIVVERVTYSTQLGMRVPAVVYRPEHSRGKAPGLVIVNGHAGDKYTWYAFYSGILYARAGAVVVTYDPIGEGERHREGKSGTCAHDALTGPSELGQKMGGLMMTDLLQAVSFLYSRPDVDPARLGALGYSMGSFVLALAGAVDTRLHACVLAGGGNLDGPGGRWDSSRPMCQALPYQSLSFLGDRPAVLYSLHASRGPTLAYNGREDATVSMTTLGPDLFRSLRERTVELRGSARGIFDYEFTTGAHRPYFVTRPVAQWLHAQLSFPRWTSETLAALPETHIGTWAREHGVTIDPLFTAESQEAGTMALDAGIPAPSRGDLSVFTPEERARNAARLTYEAWLAAAR